MAKQEAPSNAAPTQTQIDSSQALSLRWVQWSILLNVIALATLLHVAPSKILSLSSTQPSGHRSVSHQCHAPLPSLLATQPPSAVEPPLQKAFEHVETALQRRFEEGGIDSISVAIVSSDGPLYEGFWGKRRANESESATVDRHSIYRLASISKLFTAAETLILRDRGVLNLDDPITSVCPQFRYHTYYSPITFRTLMTHMSGIGRDLPAGNAEGHWPNSLFGRGPPGFNGRDFPSYQEVFDGVAESQPVVPPYTYPVYSNTGYSILGIANVAANLAVNGLSEPATHVELMERDIFGPLGLNGSSFLATEDNIHNVVVASIESGEIDQDFNDSMNPAGGQMSSLADLTKLMQVMINPRRPESILSPYTVREWMRPIHSWFDDFSEVGALWEIYSSPDSYGRKQKLYQKLGELAGHHTAFTINPVNSYGIIVMQTGPTSETIPITNLITSHVQSAFDRVLEESARQQLVGTWRSSDGSASLTVDIDHGSLYVNEYNINGTDVLRVMQEGASSARLPLWSTSDNEYRIAVSAGYEGCLFSWISLDAYGYIDGISVNVIKLLSDGSHHALLLPAIGKELLRQ